MSKFEDNGGYYIDGVPYMDCKYTGIPVKNVSTDATSVISDQALQSRMYKMFPEDYEEKTKQYKPTGRPAGWHFMNEFVDKDGNVSKEEFENIAPMLDMIQDISIPSTCTEIDKERAGVPSGLTNIT